jgi:hypothetical protein
MKKIVEKISVFIRKRLCAAGRHYPAYGGYNFTDKVSGKNVNDYRCLKCGKVWMANRAHSMFKVYKEGATVNEQKLQLK